MSVFARTPESYAAWQQLKRDVALRSDEQQRAHREKKRRELLLLLAELQESPPTTEKLERFCDLSTEITTLAEQAFIRSLEDQRAQDMCIADLQAGIEGYRRLFDEHLRLVDMTHQQHILALQKQVEVERRQRLHAENEILKAAREIQRRRDREAANASFGGMSTITSTLTSPYMI